MTAPQARRHSLDETIFEITQIANGVGMTTLPAFFAQHRTTSWFQYIF